ncbi:uncharacterized protein G2W53_018006 [Senna tora]|uniref:Uncharacterized protein n=1 Tax=Senna tora TaxID=362788 RepID=A0A834TSZ0_9FABA|nr:uncharacterized protein G2W53_018006 [Senna tora]
MALHQALSEDRQTIKPVKRYKSAAVLELKNITLTSRPFDWWGIETPDFKFKEQGIAPLGFEGHLKPKKKASRPLILNLRNKASRPSDWWGIETPNF